MGLRTFYFHPRVRERYLPWLIFLSSLCGTLLLFAINAFLFLPLASSITVGSFVFLMLSYRRQEFAIPAENALNGTQTRTIKLYSILYLLVLSISAILLSSSSYSPRPIFYGTIAVLSVLALLISASGNRIYGAIVLGTSACWLLLWPQVLFPHGFGGQDSYFHVSQVIEPIISTGFVPSQTNYTYFPAHQILVSTTSLIWGTDPRLSYYAMTALVLISVTTIIYAVSRLFACDLFGRVQYIPELAVVIYLSSSFVLRYAYQGNHLPYAISLLAVVLYATYRIVFSDGKPTMYALLALSYLALVFTHHYTSAIALLLLFTLFVVVRSRQSFMITVAAGMFTLLHWGWFAQTHGLELIVANILPLFLEFGISSPTSGSTDQPLSVLLYTTIGTAVVLFFSQIGLLAGIQSSRLRTVTIATVCYVLLGLIGIGVIIGTEGLSPNRIFFIAQVLFFPSFCAIGIAVVGPRRVLLVGCLAVFLISVLTVTGPAPAFETAALGDDVPNSKTFQTPNERAAVEWYTAYDGDRQVYTSRSFVDFQTGTAMFRPHLEDSTIDARMIPVTGDRYEKTTIEDDEVFFFSRYDAEIGYRPELDSSRRVGQAESTQLDEQSIESISSQNNNVYNDNTVRIYR